MGPEARQDTLRVTKDDLLESLVGHRAGLRLDAKGVEHLTHARANDPVKLASLGAHVTAYRPSSLVMRAARKVWSSLHLRLEITSDGFGSRHRSESRGAVARLAAPLGQAGVDEIAEILRKLTEGSRKEPGCVSYVAHYVESEPDTIVIYEQYRDVEGLEAHRSSSHFDQWATNGLYRKVRERSVETLVEIV